MVITHPFCCNHAWMKREEELHGLGREWRKRWLFLTCFMDMSWEEMIWAEDRWRNGDLETFPTCPSTPRTSSPFLSRVSALFYRQICFLSALLAAASALLAAASNGQHRGIFPLCHSPAAGGAPLAAVEWTSKGKTPFLSFPWPVLAPLAPVLIFNDSVVALKCLKPSKLVYLHLPTPLDDHSNIKLLILFYAYGGFLCWVWQSSPLNEIRSPNFNLITISSLC